MDLGQHLLRLQQARDALFGQVQGRRPAVGAASALHQPRPLQLVDQGDDGRAVDPELVAHSPLVQSRFGRDDTQDTELTHRHLKGAQVPFGTFRDRLGGLAQQEAVPLLKPFEQRPVPNAEFSAHRQFFRPPRIRQRHWLSFRQNINAAAARQAFNRGHISVTSRTSRP